MAAVRTATVTWQGPLATGDGTVSAGSSGLFTDLPVSWGSRTEAPEGRTSPEELLAAAHASCFAMALSGDLGRAGYTPDELVGRSLGDLLARESKDELADYGRWMARLGDRPE